MKSVTINASKSYTVHIGGGLLNQLGAFALQIHKPCKVCIISDSNVWPIYGSITESSLNNAGFSVVHYVFSAGEEQKNPATYIEILNFLAENQLTRADLLVALGGGVTGDMTGFAAATYLRGIGCIQVPTSLLAMVDSSVGGKTAIDLPAGKNLVGAFYQPDLVLCDTATLSTLPQSVFIDGCAEVIKYGILYDPALFRHLSDYGTDFHREDVIARCVELKRNVVIEDEFDNGSRQKLNLGHTIGHSIERCSCFCVTHGQAVAIGMAIVGRAAAAEGICSGQTRDAIIELLEKFSLPTTTSFSAQELADSALLDKKRAADSIHLILPQQIGSCIIQTIPINQIQSFIEDGCT